MKSPNLILASTSPYRRELLNRLNVSFTPQAPTVYEDQLKLKMQDLGPSDLAMSLARAKALSLSNPENCVIGGDQIVVFKNQILGKPKTFENAVKQLLSMQNNTHQLITATCVIYKGTEILIPDVTEMQMRPLSTEQIETYVKLDNPLDCAGSYKIEKLGISLFSEIKTEDFTGIQGLPLIKLSRALSKLGYLIPGA